MNEQIDHLSFSSPAIYQIEVLGELNSGLSERMGGMQITVRKSESQKSISTLIGKIKDQAELAGILTTVYELRLPLISVKTLNQ